MGSGCDIDGRAAASDIRDKRFKSQHRQKFISLSISCITLKRRNKEKEARMNRLKNFHSYFVPHGPETEPFRRCHRFTGKRFRDNQRKVEKKN